MGWWAVVQGILTVLSVAQGIKSYRQAKKLEKEANQLLIQKYGTGGGVPVIYGTRRVAGTVVFAETVNNRELFVVYALATGEVEDISDIRIGGRSIFDRSVFDHALVRKSNYYGQTQQEINNILANQDPPNKPRMVFNCHMGEDDQVADPMLVGCVPGWTNNHRLRGITYIACNFDYDSGGGMFNGLPEITCTVQGKKLYDPTKDSTVTNGSGSHRQNNTSTHEHSDNSALVLLDYLTNPIYGKGIPYSAIDIQSFITATNKHTTTTNISHSATVESINANEDAVRLVKNSSNKAVFNKLKVGNQVTITNGSTTYATGTIISKTTNTRFDDQERDYRDSNPNYVVDYDNLLIIHLSDGAVSTGLNFTETPVTITMAETGKRFPFNGVIDTEKSIFENVKDINANMRGIFTYTNGQYALKIEDSESVTLSIDDDDILSSGITVNLESKDSIYNIVEVEFANAQKDYELDTVSFKHTSATPGEDYTYDDNGEELKLTIDMAFITSQAIAYQYARAILLRSRNNKEIAFQGTPRLLNAKVGELISVTNTELGMNAEQYRITEMTINSDLTVQVNAIIYQSNIYGYVTPPGETIDIPDDPVDSFRVDTPTNLNFVDKDPSTGVQPYLTWNNSSNYPAYEFRVVIKDSSSNVLYDGRTKNTHFDLSGIQVANGYTAEVQAINTNRVESEVATYNFNNSVPPVQNNDLGDSSVTDSKVADISADKIDTGVLNLGTESGMAVRQGKTEYTSTTTGFWLGNDSGTPKFHIGTSSNFLKFDGSALNIAGSLTATNLTIDANATINGTLDASVIRLDGQDLSNLLAFGTVTGQTGNFFKINNQLDLEGRFYWDANNTTNYFYLGNGSEDNVSLYIKSSAGKPIVFQDGSSALGTFSLNFGDDVNNNNNNATDYITLLADWSNAKQSTGDVTKFLIQGRSDDLNSAPKQTIASFEFSSADGFGLAKTVFNGQIETPIAVVDKYINIDQHTAPSSTTDKLYNVGGTLYWNGAVVDTGAGDITAVNITTSLQGGLTGGANFSSGDATFTLALAGSIPGSKTFEDDIVIQGDLTVQGATTSLEVATLNVEDKNITLNYGSGDTSGSANGSGITIQDAVSQGNDATVLWNTTNDRFDFSHGLTIESDLIFRRNTNSIIENNSGNLVFRNNTDDGDIIFESDDGSGGTVQYFKLHGSNERVLVSKSFTFQDDVRARFGNGNDLQIYHVADQNSFIQNSTGTLHIRNVADDEDITIQTDNGSGSTTDYFRADGSTGEAKLYNYGNLRLSTSTDGIDVLGTTSGTFGLNIIDPTATNYGGHLSYDDANSKILIGGVTNGTKNTNISIPRDSTGIEVTGAIYVDNNEKILFADNGSGTGYSSLFRASGNATRLEFRDNVLIFDSLDNSNINIYNSSGQNAHNFIIASNVTEGAIRTYGSYQIGTSTVIDSARNITNINNVTISGNLKINSADIIHSNQTFGTFEWRANQVDSGKFSITVQGTSGAEFELYSDGSDYTNATLHIGGQKVLTQTAGINLNGDLGFNDGYKAIFGTGNDLQIYHDGSNSYIRDVGTGNLFIDATSLRFRTGAGTETYLTADGNGAVNLYYDNSPKLATNSTGIDISGNIEVGDSHLIGNDSFDNLALVSSSGENIVVGANNDIYFTTGATNLTSTGNTKLIVKNDGKVGISTTDPQKPLHVYNATTDYVARFESGDNQGGIELKDATSTSSLKTQNGSLQLIADSFNDVASSSIVFRLDALNSGEIATFNSSGLDVTGTVTSSSNIIAGSTSGASVQINASGSIELCKTAGNSDPFIDFKDSASDDYDARIRMDNNSLFFSVGGFGSITTPLVLNDTGEVDLFRDLDIDTTNPKITFKGDDGIWYRIRVDETANRLELGHTSAKNLYLSNSGNATFNYDLNVTGNLDVQGTLSAGTIAPDSVNTDTLNTEAIIFDSGSTNIGNTGARNTTTSSTSQTAIVNIASSFTSVKFQVQITDATTSSFHVTEIMVLNDGTNQYISEYGTITTGSALATFDADKTATNLRLLATPTTSNTLAYKIIYQAIYS